jgi:hypothetical protein
MYKFYIPKENYFLLNKDDLTGGLSQDYIPALSIYEPRSKKTKKIVLGGGKTQIRLEGSTELPMQPRTNGRDDDKAMTLELGNSLVGGLPTLDSTSQKKNYYFVVNSNGVPVKNGEVSYYASSPSSAAIKAFYAWWRTSKQGSKCIDRELVTDFRTSLVPEKLLQHLMAMQTDKVGQEEKKEYVKQFLCIDTEKIQKQILIRIGAAGGKSSAVRAYLVSYNKNLSPNPLEVLNKMVVTANAKPIPLTNAVPLNVTEYETLFS